MATLKVLKTTLYQGRRCQISPAAEATAETQTAVSVPRTITLARLIAVATEYPALYFSSSRLRSAAVERTTNRRTSGRPTGARRRGRGPRVISTAVPSGTTASR